MYKISGIESHEIYIILSLLERICKSVQFERRWIVVM